MAEYKKVFDSGDNFESARKFLEAARICDDVGVKEKREIDKEIKRVDKLLEDLLRSRNEQQNGEQAQPIPADDKVTLEIEIRNKKTNNLQPGFELKIKGISSSEITTLRSGAQFKVDVEKGSTHRMTAVLNDLVLGEKLIIATPQSGESTVKVTLEVGLPVAANSDIAWKDATRRNTLKAYSAYLERYPDGQYSKEAKKRIIELTPKEKSKTGNFEFRMDDNDQKGKFLIVNPIGEIKMERAGYPGSVFVLKYFEKAQGYLIQRANSYQHLKALPSNV